MKSGESFDNSTCAKQIPLAERELAAFIGAVKELFGPEQSRLLYQASGDNIEEEKALDDALYALHALKSCLVTHGRYAEAG